MKGKKKQEEKANSLQKIVLLSILHNAKTGQIHLQDAMKFLPADTAAAKSLMMAENAINSCIMETSKVITALY